ncbi:LPS assembly protein LptD [Thalassotalea sp. LPB0316]|uniref:LPS assembly protein LptD n=1 Tax=Thalassotalea sp. LPB0316 TaxID=2769490 RepID=UPI001868A523|nr:LPS assembly protein LptD [Thalassotalea sp. LPB0316]QOL26644.1 LPS assembly protein LptD [Thalassotalea sp. LPB0316]
MLCHRFLKWAFSCVFFSSFSHAANTTEQAEDLTCPIPSYAKVMEATDMLPQDFIQITSNQAYIEKNRIAKFDGNVIMSQNGQSIKADSLAFNRETSSLDASGSIHFQSDGVNVFAEHLNADKQNQSTTLSQASYQLSSNPGHGGAGIIHINADGSLSLIDSTYTTCLGESPDWQISAGKIYISEEDNVGEVYNAVVRVFDVPLLYVPYFNFPVTNKRKTGFLYPKVGSSSNVGVEVEAPFYWNIAPNMDATFTPHYMSKRGVLLNSEFRYLHDEQRGQVNFEYLNRDKALTGRAGEKSRYLGRIQHFGTFDDNFRVYVDYTTISDDNYLVDIGSKHYNSSDAYLYQISELAYFAKDWQLTAKVQDFEVLGNHIQSYRTLPQIEFDGAFDLSSFNGVFELYSEVSRFTNQDSTMPEADRYHVEAGMTFPIATPAYFLNSEFKVLQTNYKQDNLARDSKLSESVSRSLPKARVHGGIYFDRAMSKDGYTQTLEPQLQYLYVGDQDQSDIGIYDSAPLQDDYDGLFRDRRYSGLDRIAAANQLSWGLTSRILDPQSNEIFRASVGQINYFDAGKTTDNRGLIVDEETSALAADVFFQLNQQWQFSGDIQYDTHDDQTNKSQFSIDYLPNRKHTIQLNHRYIRNVSTQTLEQLSLLGTTQVGQNWQVVGRVTQDMRENRSLESYLGVQYESCCWAVRLAYHRHINTTIDDNDIDNQNRKTFDSGFVLQLVITGLSGKKSSAAAQDMLNSSIFGYKKPYFLKN